MNDYQFYGGGLADTVKCIMLWTGWICLIVSIVLMIVSYISSKKLLEDIKELEADSEGEDEDGEADSEGAEENNSE
jgi:hypothetical protein